METGPGCFDPSELDWQVDAAEKAGKSIIICTGAVKAFGYPEYFVPEHQAGGSIPEGALVTPTTHPELLAGAAEFTRRVAERYRGRPAVVAWQLEHEAFDPLGLEHSWRLSASFVDAELEALRQADPTRPVIMNGFLPTSWPVRLSQAWRTCGQGDSLAGVLRTTTDQEQAAASPRGICQGEAPGGGVAAALCDYNRSGAGLASGRCVVDFDRRRAEARPAHDLRSAGVEDTDGELVRDMGVEMERNVLARHGHELIGDTRGRLYVTGDGNATHQQPTSARSRG